MSEMIKEWLIDKGISDLKKMKGRSIILDYESKSNQK